MRTAICPRCHRPRRRQLLTPDGKVFSFPNYSEIPNGSRLWTPPRPFRAGMMLASGAALCCCTVCTDEDILPNADVSDGSWEDTTAGNSDGNLWNEIDAAYDTNPDETVAVNIDRTTDGASNIDPDAAGNEFEVHLANPAQTHGSDAAWSLKVRCHVRSDVGGWGTKTIGFRARLVQGSTVIAEDLYTGSVPDPVNTWDQVTTTITLTTAEKDSVTNQNDLRVRVAIATDAAIGFPPASNINLRCVLVALRFDCP